MSERKKSRAFDKALEKTYSGLYIYDYPDTGRAASKKKPPDRLYLWSGSVYLIEYKLPGEDAKEHQIKELIKASKQGSHSFVATILDSKSIIFEEINTGWTYMQQYEDKIGYVDIHKLFDILKNRG